MSRYLPDESGIQIRSNFYHKNFILQFDLSTVRFSLCSLVETRGWHSVFRGGGGFSCDKMGGKRGHFYTVISGGKASFFLKGRFHAERSDWCDVEGVAF